MSRPNYFFTLLLLSILFFSGFTGCSEDDEGDEPSIVGVWQHAYGSVIVSSNNIDFGLYSGKVISFNQQDHYIIFQYTNAPSWSPEQLNRFNKFVWKFSDTGSPAVIEYSEGYASEIGTTNSSGNFIAWSDAISVSNRIDIFSMYSKATNN